MSHAASTPSSADLPWDEALAQITRASRVVLLAHRAPDADALGSALALGLALESRGCDVQVSFGDDPFVVPRALTSLPGQHLIVPPSQVMATPDLVVSLDASSMERLGVVADRIQQAPLIVLDHHPSNPGFGQINLIDPAAEATAVLVLDLLDRMGVDLTASMAHALYAGLITDTGSFRYSATTPGTHARAARLLATGIRHDAIARTMFDDEPFAVMRLMGHALADMTLDRHALGGRGIAWTAIDAQMRGSVGVSVVELERIIDLVRTTSEAEVAIAYKQDDDGSWRVSTRSRGAVDVGRAMTSLGGGGHGMAAGVTLSGTRDAVHAQVLDALERVLT